MIGPGSDKKCGGQPFAFLVLSVFAGGSVVCFSFCRCYPFLFCSFFAALVVVRKLNLSPPLVPGLPPGEFIPTVIPRSPLSNQGLCPTKNIPQVNIKISEFYVLY